MSEPTTHTLKYPIEVRSAKDGSVIETITEMKLKRPKGKHLKAMDRAEGEVGKTLALIAACSGVPPSALDELDGEDFAALGEIVAPFFGERRRTGATSSAT